MARGFINISSGFIAAKVCKKKNPRWEKSWGISFGVTFSIDCVTSICSDLIIDSIFPTIVIFLFENVSILSWAAFILKYSFLPILNAFFVWINILSGKRLETNFPKFVKSWIPSIAPFSKLLWYHRQLERQQFHHLQQCHLI